MTCGSGLTAKRRCCEWWTLLNTAEQFAETYFRERGFQPERFAEAVLRGTNTPDFRILQGDELLLYCDARHVQHDEWRGERLPGRKRRKTVHLVPTPIFHSLSSHIYRAAQKFHAANPDHRYANVLVLVNSDRRRGVADLRSTVSWNFFRYRKDSPDATKYSKQSEAEIRDGIPTVDLYIWRDDWKLPDEVSGCFWRNPERREVLLKLLPGEHLWDEERPKKEIDPKLRDFIKRVIVPILVDKYLKQLREQAASVRTGETPETIGESNGAEPPKKCSD